MSTPVLDETTTSGTPATARPYLAGGLAALSVGAAAIHFAVTFAHFNEYLLYGVFFLIIAWAQMIWAAVAVWRLPRWWLWLGIAGNAMILAVYLASRTTGLPFGPDKGHTEPFGALDVVSAVLEFALIAGCAALLWRPSLTERPVRRRTGLAAIASMAAIPAGVIAATTAVMTPGWAGPEGPAGTAPGMTASSSAAAPGAQPGMGDMGTAAGYTYVLRTNGEEHLLYDGNNPAYNGLNPTHPSSLVYAINVPHHAPILLGAMYIENDRTNGPQVGGGLTRWHSHLVTCQNGKPTVAGFNVQLRGTCNPSTWRDQYTGQMLHVWVVPYTGGPFSDDLSLAATQAAVRAVLH